MEEEKKLTEKQRHTDGHRRTGTDTNRKAKKSVSVSEGPCGPVSGSTLVANAARSLLNLCCHLLDRQIEAQAKAFESEGGFTERLYRVRSARRNRGVRSGTT